MLHWCTWPQKYGPCRLLVSFDLADERFRVVPKPDCGGLERCHFDFVNFGVTCLLLHIANLENLRSGLWRIMMRRSLGSSNLALEFTCQVDWNKIWVNPSGIQSCTGISHLFMSFTFLKMEISCWCINAELWFLMIQEMEHLRIYCSPECLFGLKVVFTREPELDWQF